ncbi:hypothetical protein J3R74_000089 [Puniceicoccus vermicola]
MSFFGKEVAVIAALDDLALIENEDPIGFTDSQWRI